MWWCSPCLKSTGVTKHHAKATNNAIVRNSFHANNNFNKDLWCAICILQHPPFYFPCLPSLSWPAKATTFITSPTGWDVWLPVSAHESVGINVFSSMVYSFPERSQQCNGMLFSGYSGEANNFMRAKGTLNMTWSQAHFTTTITNVFTCLTTMAQ